MLDATGLPDRLLLLGGSSEIALALAQHYLAQRPISTVVCARPSPRRDEVVSTLSNAGASVEVEDFDATALGSHSAVLEGIAERGDIDLALVAFGVLGNQETAWREHGAAMELAMVNYVGAVSVGIVLARIMRRQGHGHIVALSSVAGERVRRSNFVYGSTKAGMDGFYLGLGEALRPEGATVTVVRPGFVQTRMTAGRDRPPFSTTTSEVAAAIAESVVHRPEITWVPGQLRLVMSILRHVPRQLFRRLPL